LKESNSLIFNALNSTISIK